MMLRVQVVHWAEVRPDDERNMNGTLSFVNAVRFKAPLSEMYFCASSAAATTEAAAAELLVVVVEARAQ